MSNAIIIEDEVPAANRLENLLTEINPNIEILAKLDSVESSVKWLTKNTHPDLIMLDIQLADGLCFDIFKKVKTNSFVIFTTAYDEFAIKAFELNSIDYLLKPIKKQFLEKSIAKFMAMRGTINFDIDELIKAIENKTSMYKNRFIIHAGNKIKPINTTNVAYFYSLEKSTYLCTDENRNYPIDFSLDTLETLINPQDFYRVNRQYFVSFSAIKNIHILSKSRIKLELHPFVEGGVSVSSNKTAGFRKWLDK